MLIKENNIKEEAYLVDALEVSEQNKMDRKCMVVKMNVEDGTFTLGKALSLYHVPLKTYLEYVARTAISEANSELEGNEKLSVSQIQLQTATAVEEYFNAIREHDSPVYISSKRITLKGKTIEHKGVPLTWIPSSPDVFSSNINFKISKIKLKSFFVDRLKDMFWNENFMKKGFSELSVKVHNETLSDIFEHNVTLRKQHLDNLNKVFEILDRKAGGKKSDAIHNFFGEANSFVSDKTKVNPIEEAGVLFAAQKIFHYNIASYGSLTTLAEQIGEPDAAGILKEAMNNEMATGIALTKISENLMDKSSGSYVH